MKRKILFTVFTHRIAWFSQNTLIILTRFLRDSGKSDEEIKKLLGFDGQVPFEMDREYLKALFAFVTSRHTDQDNDMYGRWKDYHERMLRPACGEDIETAITPDLYDALYEEVKARVLAYIPELADHQDKPVAVLLIKAGMRKEIGKRQRVQ